MYQRCSEFPSCTGRDAMLMCLRIKFLRTTIFIRMIPKLLAINDGQMALPNSPRGKVSRLDRLRIYLHNSPLWDVSSKAHPKWSNSHVLHQHREKLQSLIPQYPRSCTWECPLGQCTPTWFRSHTSHLSQCQAWGRAAARTGCCFLAYHFSIPLPSLIP